jgi:triosephosphate isomerase
VFVLVNLKAYDADPVAVARAATTVETDARVALAPQTARLAAVADAVAGTAVEVWAQHVDGVGHGSHTGHTLAESVAAAGADGTLLNHSERRCTLAAVDDGLRAAERAGLKTVVCANTPTQAGAAAALGPDAVAVEPPALIGGDTPVSEADPATVEDAVAAVDAVDPEVRTLCGAGIATGEDVLAARELGATGVLLASGVAAATDPAAALRSLLSPL